MKVYILYGINLGRVNGCKWGEWRRLVIKAQFFTLIDPI